MLKSQGKVREAEERRVRVYLLAAAAVGLVAAGLFGSQRLMIRELEREAIETRCNGAETPMNFGAPFEVISLPVADRVLQARLVRGPQVHAAALLIFHGNGEAVSDWSRVQAKLF